MSIKILVAYHKKSPLFKNDIVIPIHAGRAVAKVKSKDGVISDQDFEWLMKNMIGDDTGENISSEVLGDAHRKAGKLNSEFSQ